LPLAAGELQQLGRQLFFDRRLSADGSISCGSCHRPDRGFADPRPVSIGVGGASGKFNAPTVLNLRGAKRLFWDGRARSLEQQAEGPLLSAIEMGNQKETLEERIGAIADYRKRFRRSFGDEQVSLERITQAIAAYERTLASDQSLYDLWRRGKRDRWTPEHEAGRRLFVGKAGCAKCHFGQNFTGHQLIRNEQAKWIKVPSLREAAKTAPYLHDGSVATLMEVVAQHQGGSKLDEAQRKAIVRFIESLAGESLH
jgi:cytochrome c peroxidase